MNLKKLTSSGIPGNMPYPLNSFSAIENLVRLTDYPFNVHSFTQNNAKLNLGQEKMYRAVI